MTSVTCEAQQPIGERSRVKREPGPQQMHSGEVGIEIAPPLVLLIARNIAPVG